MSIRRLSQRGLTLIELVVFIVIVSVALAGVLTVLDITVKGSADPMIRKQMLSIAEALLEEVELQQFDYCDPNDATYSTATSATIGTPPTHCTSLLQGLGPGTTGQIRVSGTVPFNNVADYHKWPFPSPISDLGGGNNAPAGYSADITIVPEEALGSIVSHDCTPAYPAPPTDCNAMKLVRVVVTVCHAPTCSFGAGGDTLVLEGYRTRYAPNN